MQRQIPVVRSRSHKVVLRMRGEDDLSPAHLSINRSLPGLDFGFRLS